MIERKEVIKKSSPKREDLSEIEITEDPLWHILYKVAIYFPSFPVNDFLQTSLIYKVNDSGKKPIKTSAFTQLPNTEAIPVTEAVMKA